MCRVPPSGMRRRKACSIASVDWRTKSRTREEAAALSPSTAMKALLMATAILSASKGMTSPLRLMTRRAWGAVTETDDSSGVTVVSMAPGP